MNDFKKMIAQLLITGLSLDDETRACLLLGSLPDNWNTLMVSLGNSTPERKITLAMIINSLFNEEIRRNDFLGNDTHTLVTENRGRSKSRGPSGHNNSRGRSKSRGKIKCYHCGKIGHMKRNWKILKQGGDKSQKQEDNNNIAATTCTSDNEVTLLCNQEDCCHVPVAKQDVEWLVDSTTSYHCIPKREYFSTYKAGNCGTVKIGNESVSQIVGIGDICIQTSMGCTLMLKDVRHISDLRLNLISVHVLDKDGYSHFISSGNWKLTKISLVVARRRLRCLLYKTQAMVCGGKLNAIDDDTSLDLWHKRLAHMSEKGLQLLAKQSLIPIAKDKSSNPCDYCLFGKQHKVSFQNNSTLKLEKLELVYFDVGRPKEVDSATPHNAVHSWLLGKSVATEKFLSL